MKTLTLRLKPGQKIKQTLKNIAKEKQIKGGFIITGLGSLSSMDIRYANNGKETLKGPFEIVSLVGTLSQDGCHTHISLGDSKGKTISGHLKEATVLTTAEIVLGLTEKLQFSREFDKETGWKELVVR